MNAKERDQLIARDDGDATDTVYVLENSYKPDGSRSIKTSSYHKSLTCTMLTKVDRNSESVTRKDAQRRNYAPCRSCVLDGERPRCRQYVCDACEVIVTRPKGQHLRHDCLATSE